MNWQTIKQALINHYSTPLEQSFQQFRLGVGFFFIGLVILYGATQLMAPSLAQELFVLLALLIGGGGFLCAMLAQVRMIISRFVHFFRKR